jgi:uncharacterized protein YybS (DUF2232 family)
LEQLFNRNNIYALLAFLGLLLIVVYIPLGTLALMLLSVPFIYLAKTNTTQQFLILTGIVILVALILAFATGFFFTVLAASVAYVIARFIRIKKIATTYLYALLTAIANIALLIIISRLFFTLDFSTYFMDQLNKTINAGQGFFAQFTPDQSAALIESYTELFNSIIAILPFITIMVSAIYVITNYYFAVKILKRFSVALPAIPSPREWTFPRSVMYAYLVVVLFYLFSSKSDFLYNLTLNLFQIFSVIIIIQGIAFIYILLERRKLSKQWMILAVASIFLPFLNQAIQVIGIVDLAFNLRDKIPEA